MQPRGRKQELKGDARQRELLDALRSALKSGISYSDLSIEDLATRAGISRPGFYFYFKSKQEALMAALKEVRTQMVDRAEVFFQGKSERPLEELEQALAGVVDIWRKEQHLMRAFVEAAVLDESIWSGLAEFVEAFVEPAAERIVRLRKNQDRIMSIEAARQLATTLLWGNERNFYRATVSEFSQSDWDSLVATLTEIWAGAILGPNN